VGKRTCSVEGCERPHLARGWCSLHYQRWQSTGDVQVPVRRMCSVEGCDRPYKARGWCRTHYARWLAGTDVLRPIRYLHDDPARWWSAVQRGSEGECWLWVGGVTPSGYGHFVWMQGHRRSSTAHRYGYQLLVGPVPEGLDVDHLCRNKLCVNPAHLEPVTRQENVRRRDEALG
jgi:hypothetical protein